MVRLVNFYPLVIGFCLFLLESSTLAHTVKVSGKIAATFHIEPDHNPKAGEPTKAWFALTQQGGAILPLTECDCKLAVYDPPSLKNQTPLQTPVLQTISTEQYRDIPAATLIFPKAGNYELVLSGAPKGTLKFQPFELSYAVTVTAGQTTAPPAIPLDSTSHGSLHDAVTETHPSWITPAIAGSALLSLGILGFATRQIWGKRR